jgi:hypothetical protein
VDIDGDGDGDGDLDDVGNGDLCDAEGDKDVGDR